MLMYPVPQDELSLKAIRPIEAAKIYIDGIRAIEETRFYDHAGDEVLDPTTSALPRVLNDTDTERTALVAYWDVIRDLPADIEHSEHIKCLCVPKLETANVNDEEEEEDAAEDDD